MLDNLRQCPVCARQEKNLPLELLFIYDIQTCKQDFPKRPTLSKNVSDLPVPLECILYLFLSTLSEG